MYSCISICVCLLLCLFVSEMHTHISLLCEDYHIRQGDDTGYQFFINMFTVYSGGVYVTWIELPYSMHVNCRIRCTVFCKSTTYIATDAFICIKGQNPVTCRALLEKWRRVRITTT